MEFPDPFTQPLINPFPMLRYKYKKRIEPFLEEKGHLAKPSAFLLKMTLTNLKVILERELDLSAAELRGVEK